MARKLVVRPSADEDFTAILEFIAEESLDSAIAFIDSIEKRCYSLLDFPEQGRARDDLRVGLRVLPFGRSVVIAYQFDAEAVEIMRVFYGGQDYEALMRE